MDVGGELVGELDPLITFFQQHRAPADLGENTSVWSIVLMSPGYRERNSVWHEEPGIRLRLLNPVDFVIARLRRGTDQDLDDAEYLAQRFQVLSTAIRSAAESAIAASPGDAAIFFFKKTVENFRDQLT